MTETCRRHVADTTQNVAVWAKKRHADIRHVELSLAARTKILERKRRQGIVPKHQILDNQCSARMKLAMDTTVLLDGSISKTTYELVPPDEHRRNIAEKAIQTFKDHFIGVLSGCAKNMPMHLWCQLLPQVERQLLLLRQSG